MRLPRLTEPALMVASVAIGMAFMSAIFAIWGLAILLGAHARTRRIWDSWAPRRF